MNINQEINKIQEMAQSSKKLKFAIQSARELVRNHPDNLDAWTTLISAEMATPEEDYENASKHLFEAYNKFPDNSVLFALGIYLSASFFCPLEEKNVAEIEPKIDEMDNKSKGIVYFTLAEFYLLNKNPEQYESYLLKAINVYSEFPRYYLDLGLFYISNNNEEGKLYIKKGLDKVRGCFSGSARINVTFTLYSFIDEIIGGLYLFDENYKELKELSS